MSCWWAGGFSSSYRGNLDGTSIPRNTHWRPTYELGPHNVPESMNLFKKYCHLICPHFWFFLPLDIKLVNLGILNCWTKMGVLDQCAAWLRLASDHGCTVQGISTNTLINTHRLTLCMYCVYVYSVPSLTQLAASYIPDSLRP